MTGISVTQQYIINKIMDHFQAIGQRPDRHTFGVMVEVVGQMEGGEVQKEVRYMKDGKSNSVHFVYDHPGAYAKFYAEFWRQWNARQS